MLGLTRYYLVYYRLLIMKLPIFFILSLIILGTVLTVGYFCQLFSHFPGHHTETEISFVEVFYHETSTYEQCCSSGSDSQLQGVAQPTQKFVNTLATTPSFLYKEPITTYTQNKILSSASLALKPNPGGVVLLC